MSFAIHNSDKQIVGFDVIGIFLTINLTLPPRMTKEEIDAFYKEMMAKFKLDDLWAMNKWIKK